MAKVVVLGGGFAGLEAAIFLRKRGIATTLIAERDFLWIYPISIWIPTGGIAPEKVKMSLAELAKKHGFELIIDPVKALDPARQVVALADSEVSYDYLILAMGQAKMKPPGVEHTLSICGAPDQAMLIRDRLQELVKQGGGKVAFGFGGNPKDKSAVRGGPVFEVLFNVDHWLKKKKIRDRFDLHFFAPMEKPGEKMGPKALDAMEGFYKRAQVTVHTGTKIRKFTEQGVELVDDTTLLADLVLFTPAGAGHPLVKDCGLSLNEAGFVEVDAQCRAKGQERIWAAGDIAALEGPSWGAKQGHVAEVMARIAAEDIALAMEHGGHHRALDDYRKHIEILCLMDAGNGGAMVHRTEKKASLIPLPFIGHWMKVGWGFYWKWSKMGRIPRLPGM